MIRLILLGALIGASTAAAETEDQRFRIQVREDGVYRVDYEHLQAAGLDGPVESRSLALTNRGRSIAIRVDDGGDGRFDRGDSLVFPGRHLRGETTYFHEFSPFNVYVLSTAAATPPARIETEKPAQQSESRAAPSRLEGFLHLERDQLRVPLSGPTGTFGTETLWYWKQFNHLASQPTRLPLDLSGIDPGKSPALSLRIRFRGWSDHASTRNLGIPDHVVDIALNGRKIGTASWDGRATHQFEIPSVSPDLIRAKDNVLEMRLPLRHHGDQDDPVIDVVYLDWVQVHFPHGGQLGEGQQRLRLVTGQSDSARLLIRVIPTVDGMPADQLEIFGTDGFWARARSHRTAADSSHAAVAYEALIPPGTREVWVVPDGVYRRPHEIRLDRPSSLRTIRNQRDYVIIAHSSLLEAVRPLARFHNSRGMSTQLVDVQDIYDEFNFGIEHPEAIRAFLAHAWETADSPPPSHVLLVGDANWYVKQQVDGAPDRGLIPTWPLRSRDGPAASDNPYVTLEGDDIFPDMAIGRLPARTPEEAQAMIDKTIAYMESPPSGSWRSRVLLVSDQTRNLSARNERLGAIAESHGMSPVELLSTGGSGEMHQDRLRSAIHQGALVLHFFGHGGRYMWQTAPANSGGSGNLFDMDDLDRLPASDRLPIVLSMSCNTGPFDHPSADSLAEKFLSMGDRGAVAVLAASARNSPSIRFTSDLLTGILGEDTLGQAIRQAKSARQHPDNVLLYNLLGDPALVPARP